MEKIDIGDLMFDMQQTINDNPILLLAIKVALNKLKKNKRKKITDEHRDSLMSLYNNIKNSCFSSLTNPTIKQNILSKCNVSKIEDFEIKINNIENIDDYENLYKCFENILKELTIVCKTTSPPPFAVSHPAYVVYSTTVPTPPAVLPTVNSPKKQQRNAQLKAWSVKKTAPSSPTSPSASTTVPSPPASPPATTAPLATTVPTTLPASGSVSINDYLTSGPQLPDTDLYTASTVYAELQRKPDLKEKVKYANETLQKLKDSNNGKILQYFRNYHDYVNNTLNKNIDYKMKSIGKITSDISTTDNENVFFAMVKVLMKLICKITNTKCQPNTDIRTLGNINIDAVLSDDLKNSLGVLPTTGSDKGLYITDDAGIRGGDLAKDINFQKYLKYKSKYLQLRNNL